MKYMQFPISVFCKLFPEVASVIPLSVRSDEKYFVRVCTVTGAIEFGYFGDSWVIR